MIEVGTFGNRPANTAFVTMKGGAAFHLCDAWDELRDALEGDARFIAHQIRGQEPHETIVNPLHVATVERGPESHLG